MSNVGRPRTGLKECAFDGSTERDSNGQCSCRNTLYRLTQRAATADVPKVKVTYNDVLKEGKPIPDAVAAVRGEFPYLATRKAPAAKAPKAKAEKKTPKQKKAAVAKAEKIIDEAKTEAVTKAAAKKTEKARYILHIEDDWTEPKPYARKDAAIKNGVRSGEAWKVVLNGKTVAASDDLI